MEAFICFMFFIAMVVSSAIWLGLATRSSTLRREPFRILSVRMRGIYEQAGLFNSTRVTFRRGNSVCIASEFKESEMYWYRFVFQHENREALAIAIQSVAKNGSLARTPPSRSYELVESGDGGFDSRFIAFSIDKKRGLAALTPAVRFLIEKLAAGSNGVVRLRMDERNLTVTAPAIFSRPTDLYDRVNWIFELYGHMMLAECQGIDFVNEESASLLVDVLCPVCGVSIESEMVICARCKTPHHHECWNYIGNCSTFACGEKIYTIPAMADAPPPPPQSPPLG